jgi:hypothetical protein
MFLMSRKRHAFSRLKTAAFDKEQIRSMIHIPVYDPEFALALAAGGLPPKFVKDHEDGPALVLSVEDEQALCVVDVLLGMIPHNPRLIPDLAEMIARLLRWEKEVR